MNNDSKKQTIAELLLSRKFDPQKPPPVEQIVLTIAEKTIGALGSYVVFSGQAKAGKSTFLSATVASAFISDFQDIFTIKLKLPKDRPRIAYFDTESSAFDFYNLLSRIKKFTLRENYSPYLDAYNTREDSPKAIRAMINTYLETHPDCSCLVIDGFLDLCLNYNDEVETRKIVNWLKIITKRYNILLIGVLHLSKGSGETLGHLGSNTDRWAQSTLTVEKDKNTRQFILKPKFLRSSDDFAPIALMQFNGEFTQVDYQEQTLIPLTKKR